MSGFWKPGNVAPGVNVERDNGKDSSGDADVVIFNPNENLSISKQRKMLYVSKIISR